MWYYLYNYWPQILFCALYVIILLFFLIYDYDLDLLQNDGIQCIIHSISMYMTLGHLSWTSTNHAVNTKYRLFYYGNRLVDVFVHGTHGILYLNDLSFGGIIHFVLCIVYY